MTFEEALDLPNNAPILLKDKKFGLVIRYWKPDELGVQVPGEENIRAVKVENIMDTGDGALIECLSREEKNNDRCITSRHIDSRRIGSENSKDVSNRVA